MPPSFFWPNNIVLLLKNIYHLYQTLISKLFDFFVNKFLQPKCMVSFHHKINGLIGLEWAIKLELHFAFNRPANHCPLFLISSINKISFWKVVTSFKNHNRPCNFTLTFQKHSKYLLLGYGTRFLCILHPHLRKTNRYVCVYSIISFSLCMTIIGYAFEFWNNKGYKMRSKTLSRYQFTFLQ